jgi:hypothetical protein
MNAKQIEGVRRRRTRAEVEKLVSEYEASGLRQQQFCEEHGLSLSTLNRHRKRKQRGPETPTHTRLIPVEISEKQRDVTRQGGELVVWLSSGRRIEVRGGFDPKVLEQLVRVLERA